jgi:hypothetical protein
MKLQLSGMNSLLNVGGTCEEVQAKAPSLLTQDSVKWH